MQWKQLQKILEPRLGDASKSVSRFLEENASSLEDFLAVQGDRYYPRSGGIIYGNVTIGNTLRVIGAMFLEQQLWRKYGNNQEPVGHTHVGMVVPYAGTATRPNGGWLMCDGTAYNQADYPYLFEVIGNTYDNHCGAASPPAGQFRVPNYKGRTLVGQDPSDSTFNSLTDYGGAKTHTLTVAEMPSHNHDQEKHTHVQDPHDHDGRATRTFTSSGHTHDNADYFMAGVNGAAVLAGGGISIDPATATNQDTTALNKPTGDGGAHNNLQPYAVVNYIIKY